MLLAASCIIAGPLRAAVTTAVAKDADAVVTKITKKEFTDWQVLSEVPMPSVTIEFEAHASKEIHIGLQNQVDEAQKNMTLHIVLGGWGNTQHSVTPMGTDVAPFEQKGSIPSAAKFIKYRLDIAGTTVKVDYEKEAGVWENTLLYKEKPAASYTHYAFAADKGSWRLRDAKVVYAGSGNMSLGQTVTVSDDAFKWVDDHRVDADKVQGFTLDFQAKAASDITIGLHNKDQYPSDDYAYQITLGAHSNTESLVHLKNEGKVVYKDTQTIPNTNDFVSYRLTVRGQMISVDYEQDGKWIQLLSFADSSYGKEVKGYTHYAFRKTGGDWQIRNVALGDLLHQVPASA